MKIIVCGSMVFSRKMVEVKNVLEEKGCKVTLPAHTEEYAELEKKEEAHSEAVKNKIEEDLIRDHWEKMKEHDAVLIINEDKNGKKNYIGGNAFLEMGFAHVLEKEIFVLNGMPEVNYKDEITAIQPVFLKGDLGKI